VVESTLGNDTTHGLERRTIVYRTNFCELCGRLRLFTNGMTEASGNVRRLAGNDVERANGGREHDVRLDGGRSSENIGRLVAHLEWKARFEVGERPTTLYKKADSGADCAPIARGERQRKEAILIMARTHHLLLAAILVAVHSASTTTTERTRSSSSATEERAIAAMSPPPDMGNETSMSPSSSFIHSAVECDSKGWCIHKSRRQQVLGDSEESLGGSTTPLPTTATSALSTSIATTTTAAANESSVAVEDDDFVDFEDYPTDESVRAKETAPVTAREALHTLYLAWVRAQKTLLAWKLRRAYIRSRAVEARVKFTLANYVDTLIEAMDKCSEERAVVSFPFVADSLANDTRTAVDGVLNRTVVAPISTDENDTLSPATSGTDREWAETEEEEKEIWQSDEIDLGTIARDIRDLSSTTREDLVRYLDKLVVMTDECDGDVDQLVMAWITKWVKEMEKAKAQRRHRRHMGLGAGIGRFFSRMGRYVSHLRPSMAASLKRSASYNLVTGSRTSLSSGLSRRSFQGAVGRGAASLRRSSSTGDLQRSWSAGRRLNSFRSLRSRSPSPLRRSSSIDHVAAFRGRSPSVRGARGRSPASGRLHQAELSRAESAWSMRQAAQRAGGPNFRAVDGGAAQWTAGMRQLRPNLLARRAARQKRLARRQAGLRYAQHQSRAGAAAAAGGGARPGPWTRAWQSLKKYIPKKRTWGNAALYSAAYIGSSYLTNAGGIDDATLLEIAKMYQRLGWSEALLGADMNGTFPQDTVFDNSTQDLNTTLGDQFPTYPVYGPPSRDYDYYGGRRWSHGGNYYDSRLTRGTMGQGPHQTPGNYYDSRLTMGTMGQGFHQPPASNRMDESRPFQTEKVAADNAGGIPVQLLTGGPRPNLIHAEPPKGTSSITSPVLVPLQFLPPPTPAVNDPHMEDIPKIEQMLELATKMEDTSERFLATEKRTKLSTQERIQYDKAVMFMVGEVARLRNELTKALMIAQRKAESEDMPQLGDESVRPSLESPPVRHSLPAPPFHQAQPTPVNRLALPAPPARQALPAPPSRQALPAPDDRRALPAPPPTLRSPTPTETTGETDIDPDSLDFLFDKD
jgi:hypothetical protein